MTIQEQIYKDYLLIKGMHSDKKVKKRILTELFSQGGNPWRVVGITKKALLKFKEDDYKKVSKMGINRSHIYSRSETYDNLLKVDFKNSTEFWDYYYNRDFTIFATTSENKKNEYSDIYFFPNSENLFKSRGYAWVHNKKESDFLREIQNNGNIKTIEDIKHTMQKGSC